LRASCDSTEERKKYKTRGAVASLEILLHAIYYLHSWTCLYTSLSGVTRPAPGSRIICADDHRVIRQRDEVIRDHLRRTRNTSHGTTKDSRAHRQPRWTERKAAVYAATGSTEDRHVSRAGQGRRPPRMKEVCRAYRRSRRAELKITAEAGSGRAEHRRTDSRISEEDYRDDNDNTHGV